MQGKYLECPTVVLSLEPQYKRIAPSVFWRGSRFRFRVWRYLKTTLFTVFHTCSAAIMLISHPFCEGGGGGWRKLGLPPWGRSNYLSPYLLFSSAVYGDCYRLVGNAVFFLAQHAYHHWNCNRPSLPLCTYVPAPLEHDSPQVRVTAITEATGNCTLWSLSTAPN
jgi:hypothetical protein